MNKTSLIVVKLISSKILYRFFLRSPRIRDAKHFWRWLESGNLSSKSALGCHLWYRRRCPQVSVQEQRAATRLDGRVARLVRGGWRLVTWCWPLTQRSTQLTRSSVAPGTWFAPAGETLTNSYLVYDNDCLIGIFSDEKAVHNVCNITHVWLYIVLV